MARFHGALLMWVVAVSSGCATGTGFGPRLGHEDAAAEPTPDAAPAAHVVPPPTAPFEGTIGLAPANTPPEADRFVIPAGCEGLPPPGTSWGRVDVWDGRVFRLGAERFYDLFANHFERELGETCEQAQARAGRPRDPCLWPSLVGLKQQVVVRQGEWAALKFRAHTGEGFADRGSIIFEDGSFGGSAQRIYAIARCPGQFDIVETGCAIAGLAGRLRWTTTGSPSFGECSLEPNQVYYLNIINAEAHAPSVPTCPTDACTNLTQVGG